MLKKLLSLLVLVFAFGMLKAQLPDPCPSNTEPPSDDCSSACIYCNFNGINSTTIGYTQGSAPDFCGTIENDQWLGFIAGAANATFTATPTSCQGGNGVQIALYTDCNASPIACNQGSMGGNLTPVSITSPLIPGVNYFLLIDGFAGDQCDFTITVVPPSAVQAPNVGPTGAIAGPATICPGADVAFSIPTVAGAGAYLWTGPPGTLFDGEPSPATLLAPNGNTPTITLPTQPGNYQICVQPLNSCFNGTQVCRNIIVAPIPPTILSPVVICPEDAPYELPWGSNATTTGNYLTTLQSWLGCDSIVRQFVTVKPTIITNLPFTAICAGDFVEVCGDQFFDGGNFSVVCESFQGCDSLITFSILYLNPVADIIGNGVITCNNNLDTLLSAQSAGIKTWRNLAGALLGTGNFLVITAPGTYILNVSVVGGGKICTDSDTVVIIGNTTPPTVSASGGLVGCGLGAATLGVTTNANPPTFAWSGPGGFTSTLQSPMATVPGTYVVTVTSGSNGCTNTASAVVTGNTTPPDVTTVGGQLSCNVTTVTINANSTVPNATFAWTGPNSFSSVLPNPAVNTPGTYTVIVTSPTNNCTSTATAIVTIDNALPGANIIVGGTISCTTPSISLTGTSAPGAGFSWTGPNSFTSSIANPVVDTAGTYTLTTTGTNGCTSTSSAVVNGDVIPPGVAATGGLLNCTISSVQIGSSSPAIGATFAWTGPNSFASTNQNPTVTEVGTYTVTATGTNACTSTTTAVVDGDFVQPDVQATGGIISCSSSSTTISGSSTTPGVTYGWTGPSNFTSSQAINSVFSVGIYTLTVTAPNGCTNVVTAGVDPDASVPNVSASGGLLTCAITSVMLDGGSTTPGVTTTWTGPNGFTSNLEDPIVTDPGTYTLIVNNPANGCSAQITALVNLNNTAPGATATGGTVTCAVPMIQLAGGSATAGATFAWTGPNGFSSTLQNPDVDVDGTYDLVVTNPVNGCTSASSATVLADQAAPQANITTNILTCSTTSVILNATALVTVTWAWTGPNSFTSTLQNPDATDPGDYTLTVTALNGCTSSTSITVFEDVAAPDVQVAGDTIDCVSSVGSVTGNSATPGVTWFWTGPNNFTSAQQSPSVTIPGTYVLTVTGLNGCTSSASTVVAPNTDSPVVALTGGGTLTCTDVTLPVIGTISTPGATGVWTLNGTFVSDQGTIDVTVQGTYVYTVTAVNGCVSAPSITVLQNIQTPQNVTAAGGLLNCSFPTINLAGSSSTSNVSYGWTGPGNFVSNQQNPAVGTSGTYILTVTNLANGCTTTATTVVTQDPTVPDIDVTTEILNCVVSSVTLNATSNTPNVTYVWTGPNGFASTQEDPVVSSPGGYAVVVTAQSGCTSQFSVEVLQDTQAPGVSATGDTLTCTIPVGSINSISPTSSVVYSWTGPGNFTSNVPNPVVTLTGAYTVTVENPVNGCISSATVDVLPDESIPQVTVTGGTITCVTTSIQLTATSNNPSVTFGWSGPNNFTSSIPNPSVGVPGAYTLIVTAPNGCTNGTGVTVEDDTQGPVVTTGVPNQLDCNTSVVSLNADVSAPGVYTYQWSTLNGNIQSGVNSTNPTVSQAGTYTVLVTDTGNGCTNTREVTVLVDPSTPTAAFITEKDVNCFGDTNGSIRVDSVAGGASPYLYSIDGGPFSSTPIFTGLEPNVFEVTIEDANGCLFTTNATVGEPAELVVNLGDDVTIQLGETIQLTIDNVVSDPSRVEDLIVNPAELENSFCDTCILRPFNSFQYTVTVVDENGCKATDKRVIIVRKDRLVYIPNIFNPESDLNNNIFMIFGGQDVDRIKSFQVFDRWGSKVHEYNDFLPNDVASGWDGRVRGDFSSPAVFSYFAEILFIDGETILYKGDVTLIRL